MKYGACRGDESAWASERAIVAEKPGNAGGAKGLTSERLSKETKEKVIDMSLETPVNPGVSAEAIHQSEAGTELSVLPALRQDLEGAAAHDAGAEAEGLRLATVE